MNQENESVFSEQVKQWPDEYERQFGMSGDDVVLSEEEQIPPDEMRRYVDNYRKWFETDASTDELKLKLKKLKKIRGCWQLNTDYLDKIIKYIESRLS